MQHDRERDRDPEMPNRASNKEPAEGSRETVERGVGSEVPSEAFGEREHEGGGISNRPIDDERGRQEQVPPRGKRREDTNEDVER